MTTTAVEAAGWAGHVQAYGATVAPGDGTVTLTAAIPGWTLAITSTGWRLILPSGSTAASGRWSVARTSPGPVAVLAVPGALWVAYGPETAYAQHRLLEAPPAETPVWAGSPGATCAGRWALMLPDPAWQQPAIPGGILALDGHALASLQSLLGRAGSDAAVVDAWGGQDSAASAVTLDLAAHGAQPGDRVVLAVGTAQQTYDWAPAEAAGWQVLLDRRWQGTLKASVLVSPYLGSERELVCAASGQMEAGWQAVLLRNTTGAPQIAAGKARAEAPAEQTTVTCPSTTTTAPGLVLAVGFERTMAAEADGQPVMTGADEHWRLAARTQQEANPQTVASAWRLQAEPGNTGAVVFEYPNPQALNGYGVQLWLPGQATTGAPAWAPPPAEPATVTGYLLDATNSAPAYVAHRCASGAAAGDEFTVEGVRAAAAAGYRAIEVSVYRCATGEYVASHDWTVQRVTGQPYQIWRTDWETLAALTQTGGHQLYRLDDLLDAADEAGMVVCLDCKQTSSQPTVSEDAQQAHRDLIQLVQARYGAGLSERVVWKGFADPWGLDLARAAGMRTMGMLYDSEVAGADLSRWDILGLEYSASEGSWAALTATGKPTIAHIINSAAQARQGLARGAAILMCSTPAVAAPGMTY